MTQYLDAEVVLDLLRERARFFTRDRDAAIRDGLSQLVLLKAAQAAALEQVAHDLEDLALVVQRKVG